MMFVPPVIDLTPLRDGDPATIDALDRACLETGFLAIVGHGLDAELDAVFGSARDFFERPQAEKEQVPRLDRYGYVPHAEVAIDQSRASQRTEFIDMGLVGRARPGPGPGAGGEFPLPALDGFEAAVRAYQTGAIEVSAVLLRALATALGIEPDFFARRMVEPQCRLRFLHYPPVEPLADGTLPVPTDPHTDYGLITLLATDGVPGLEVRPIGQDWCPIPTERGQVVVNLGDMMARWTNDRYRSTPHRVVGPASGDRISIPFFVNPDPTEVVETIPSCVTDERPLRYEPVTAGEFLARRIDGGAVGAEEPYVDRTEGPPRRKAQT